MCLWTQRLWTEVNHCRRHHFNASCALKTSVESCSLITKTNSPTSKNFWEKNTRFEYILYLAFWNRKSFFTILSFERKVFCSWITFWLGFFSTKFQLCRLFLSWVYKCWQSLLDHSWCYRYSFHFLIFLFQQFSTVSVRLERQDRTFSFWR